MIFDLGIQAVGNSGQVSITPTMTTARTITLRERNTTEGCLWVGPSGIGKSTTANWMIADGAGGVRGLRIDCPLTVNERNAGEALQGAILSAVQGSRVDMRQYRGRSLPNLTEDLVHLLHKRRVEMIYLDEAQRLSDESLEALHRLIDRSREVEREGVVFWVLIGSGDLPDRIEGSAHLKRRLGTFVPFESWGAEDLSEFLRALYADRISKTESIESIAEAFLQKGHCTPDQVVKTVRRIAQHAAVLGSDTVCSENLEKVVAFMTYSRKCALDIRASGYRPGRPVGRS